jgi:SAM-dependent methyltransferase
MGYVFDFKDSLAYVRSMEKPHNQHVSRLQNRLMFDMLKPKPLESVVDIGCGSGLRLLPFLDMDLQVTGVDPSLYMLDIARKKIGNRCDLHQGIAEDLPFEDNAFNHAILVTTLEFVDDTDKAIEEACRVAKDHLFIGVLNRYSLKSVQRRIAGIFTQSIYNRAHFFSIWEIKRSIQKIMGDVPISWRTVCHFSRTGDTVNMIERSDLVKRCPFGAFTGVVVTLLPKFKTRPLSLKYPAGQHPDAIAGL